MSYRFDAGQPLSAEVRRIFFEEIDFATKQLTKSKDKNRDESIHEARKSIKKLRGLLRLVAPLIGKAVYRKENQELGAIGRRLSELRDARAIIEIFESVTKEAEAHHALDPELIQSLGSHLEKHKVETEEKIDVEETLASAVSALQDVRGHVDGYQLDGDGFESLERGFKDVYRRGRKAMKQAVKAPSADSFHNWRKRIKDHWYHMRLLGALNTAFTNTREDDLKKLETWLGDDHNLAVLRGLIDDYRTELDRPKQVRQFLHVAKQHGQELRQKAVELGGHLYELKPKQLLKELVNARELWPVQAVHLDAQADSAHALPQTPDKSPGQAENLSSNKPTVQREANRRKQPKKTTVTPARHSRRKAQAQTV